MGNANGFIAVDPLSTLSHATQRQPSAAPGAPGAPTTPATGATHFRFRVACCQPQPSSAAITLDAHGTAVTTASPAQQQPTYENGLQAGANGPFSTLFANSSHSSNNYRHHHQHQQQRQRHHHHRHHKGKQQQKKEHRYH